MRIKFTVGMLIGALFLSLAPTSQAQSQVRAEQSCLACVVWVTRGVLTLGGKLSAKKGAQVLRKTKLRRHPGTRAKIRATGRRMKRGIKVVALRYKANARLAVRDCFVIGGAHYVTFGSLKVAIFSCGTAAYARVK